MYLRLTWARNDANNNDILSAISQLTRGVKNRYVDSTKISRDNLAVA